ALPIYPGQATEQRRSGPPVLGEIRGKTEQQAQPEQPDGALAKLDAPPQLPVPQAVHRQVQPAEMDQHRRDQTPPLTAVERGTQIGQVYTLAVDTKVDEAQPANGGKVLAR